jgi:hypothetical protein
VAHAALLREVDVDDWLPPRSARAGEASRLAYIDTLSAGERKPPEIAEHSAGLRPRFVGKDPANAPEACRATSEAYGPTPGPPPGRLLEQKHADQAEFGRLLEQKPAEKAEFDRLLEQKHAEKAEFGRLLEQKHAEQAEFGRLSLLPPRPPVPIPDFRPSSLKPQAWRPIPHSPHKVFNNSH